MSEPTFSPPDPEPGPAIPRPTEPPRRVPRRGRIAILGVLCAALVAAVLITLISVPEALPAPRVLAHDPVPAERIRWAIPAHCGISTATVRALTPKATIDQAGDQGSCRWFSDPARSGGQTLEVGITAHHAGPGVPGVTDDGNSSVAAAITGLGKGTYQGATTRPVTGLGDDAIVSELRSDQRIAVVGFRTGNVTARAEYSADSHPFEGKALSAGALRAGALRAAAEVARALGAPATPKVAAAPSAPAAAHLPASACRVVPPGLRKRLVGESGVDYGADEEQDPYAAGSVLPETRTRTCGLQPHGRYLGVVITNGTGRTAAGDAVREYLRRYLDERAVRPASAGDQRYFHALGGLGDQAFCAYPYEGAGAGSFVVRPALVVVRVGAVLISVTYGAVQDAETGDLEPLTQEEAVGGAYAVAVRVARAVRP